jgi:glycosyltransferase involved in cell wall biosynthesis
MKVLMVTERYIPIWGGAENQLRQLIPHLVRHGVEIEVVTRRWHEWMPSKDVVDTVVVRRLGVPGTGALSTIFFIVSLLFHLLFAARKVQVFHSHGAVKIGALCALAARITRKKNVAKIASAGRIPQLAGSKTGRLVIQLFLQSDGIICMTDEIERELQEISSSPDKLFRVCNAVDCERFTARSEVCRQEFLRQHGIKDTSILVVFCSRLVYGKGLDILLTSWPEVLKSHPLTCLIVIGSGNDQQDSIETAMKQKVVAEAIESVFFLGGTEEPEKYLGIADIFVFPSRREGFPNALMEALATGLPTIASRIGGVVPLIEEGKNGLLFESEDSRDLAEKINWLVDNVQLRTILGKQAREAMRSKYSFEEIAGQYAAYYHSIDKL